MTCDRVAIVKRGRLVRVGTLDELTAGATQIEIRAAGLTAGLVAGLAQWGQIAGVANCKPQMISADGGVTHSYASRQITQSRKHAVTSIADADRLLLTVPNEDVLPAIADVSGAGRRTVVRPGAAARRRWRSCSSR